jgi:hypothetical protein
VIDYGSISHTLPETSKPVSLGMGNSGGELTVTCDAATPLTFRVTDNRLGTASASGSKYFGLGNVNGTGKLGYYTIKAAFPRVDGETKNMFVTADNTIGSGATTVDFEHGKRVGWLSSSASKEQAIGKVFSFMLLTEAFLAKRGDMQGGIGEDTRLDGSATLEFGFGL